MLLVLLPSCDSESLPDDSKEVLEVADHNKPSKKVTIKLDTISFTLPDISGSSTDSFQFLDFESPQFSFYDKTHHDILIFDLESGKYLDKIELQNEGPDGVGLGSTGVYWINKDSIIISNKMKLHLINRSGKVLETFTLNMPELGGFPDFQVSTLNPVIKKSDIIYVSVYPQKSVFKELHLQNWYNFVSINLKDGTKKPLVRLPLSMKENIYGFNFVGKSFIEFDDRVLISFYPLKNLYTVDLDSPNILVQKEIKSPGFYDVQGMTERNPSEFMNYTKHYLLNESFEGLYKNDNYILRIALKAISTEELNERDWSKEKVFQLYDTNLNLVYELDTKSKYGNYYTTLGYSNIFISKIKSDEENVIVFLKLTINENDEE